MSNPSMLGMPTYVKTMVLLSSALAPVAALAESKFDELGKKNVGSDWDSVKTKEFGGAGDGATGVDKNLENFVNTMINLMWLFGILIGAGFTLFGVIKFITASKNQQPIMPGVIYFIGGLVLMVLGVLSWVFAAQIKNLFI